MTVYRPRMAARLHVPITSATRAGAIQGRTDTVTLPIRVRSATIEYNDHNHADTLQLTAEWKDAGIDPRYLRSATCEFWLGEADDDGTFTPSEKNFRFVGILNRAKRIARSDSGFSVDLEFHDYTALFLQQKPFTSRGVPSYSDTLQDAWRKICDYTGPLTDDGTKVLSSVEVLRDRLEFRGTLSNREGIADLVLGRAVSARFAKLATVPVKPGSDAWAVWLQCVGSLGLISYIDRDRCIVTTSTEYYTASTAPKLVWGMNVSELEESTNAAFSDKGVAITSFDPLSGTTIEAFYPPPQDERINRKRIRASKRGSPPPAPDNSERYDFFEYNGVTDPAILDEIARRAWDERSRQELEGTLKTAEMRASDVSGAEVDLLDIRAGDAIKVEIDPTDSSALTSLGSRDVRAKYLVERGYSQGVADLMARNAESLDALEKIYHATRVAVDFDVDEDGGKFEVSVSYHNRIKVG